MCGHIHDILHFTHSSIIRRKLTDVAESGDDFTKSLTIFQWFQTLIHPALMQRQN
ncbi:MAG: hypothetical protein HRU34_10525 [Richelia sp.]|nr:hypothetical protein [Richelia sp.]CDN16499.1 Hemolysins and related proteins containing CBS domains [Richelia intracellularis]